MSFNDRIQKLNYSFTPKTLRNRLINSAASSMLRHNGGNNLIVLVPATPVNTFCSNNNLERISLIGSSNSIPIINPRPRISLIPGNLCNYSSR